MGSAAATTMADVSSAMVTALTSVATQMLSGISAIVPVAAPVLGALLIVNVAIRSFRKVSGSGRS